MGRKLARNVVVDGVAYGPDFDEKHLPDSASDEVKANKVLFEPDEDAVPVDEQPKASRSSTKS